MPLGASMSYKEGDKASSRHVSWNVAKGLGREDYACSLKDSIINTTVEPKNCSGHWRITIACHANQKEVIPVTGGVEWPVNISNTSILVREMNETFNCTYFGLHFDLIFGKEGNCGVEFTGRVNGYCNKTAVQIADTIVI